MADDSFTPKPGRIRQTGTKPARRFTKQVMARIERAGGSRRLKHSQSAFTGGRTGRGLGARFAHGFRGLDRRRVIVKIRLVKFGKGATRFAAMAGARAHLTYLQRESAVQEKERTPSDDIEPRRALDGLDEEGRFYSAERDQIDGMPFLAASDEDRHQFRIIVSPEDGTALASLKEYTRNLMRGVESDLDTRLDWIAVDHFNTGHPHTHIVLRGKDDRGEDLVIARDYIRHGFRQRAELNLTRELGPRPVREIAASLKQEMSRDRFTSLDRDLISRVVVDTVDLPSAKTAYDRFRSALRAGRLRTLERMGLAREISEGQWQLKPDLRETLVRMGERGDIIRTMQRAYGHDIERQIFDGSDPAQVPVTGELVASGLRDSRDDRKYLIVNAVDGRQWYAEFELDEPLPRPGGIVTLSPARGNVKPSDRTIDRIARLNGGTYSSELHRAVDGPQSDGFLTAHKRRLEALRRKGIVMRAADGSWRIPEDYLSRVTTSDGAGIKLDVASWVPVRDQVSARSRVWLDDLSPDVTSAVGFGKNVRQAVEHRRQFLLANRLARDIGRHFDIDTEQLETLTKAAIDREGVRIAAKLGRTYLAFSRTAAGTYLHSVDLPAGRYAVIDQGRTVTLVRWSRTLERYRGQQVRAQMRSRSVNWSVSRTIPLPPR